MEKEDKKRKKEEPGKEKNFPRIEITELFMAKCGKNGWDRCYQGTINRENDESGKEIAISGTIYMKDEGMFWARAEDQLKLGELLDTILEMRLVYSIHKDKGVFSKIAEERFFHN